MTIRSIVVALLGVALMWCAVPAGADEEMVDEDFDPDHYMNRTVHSCADVTLNAIWHLPRFIEEDKPDSARAILDYWHDTCPPYEFLARTDVLLRVWDDSFSERHYDDTLVWDLVDFRRHLRNLRQPDVDPVDEWLFWEYHGIDAAEMADYDDALFAIAEQLVPYTEEGTIANLLVRNYAGQVDDIFVDLRASEFEGTALRKDYDRAIYDLAAPSYPSMGFYVGSWHPTGGLDRIGPLATLGLVADARFNRLHLRIPADLSIGGEKEGFVLNDGGELIDSEDFGRVYIGFEPAWTMVDRRRLRVDLIAGIGYAGVRWRDGSEDIDPGYLGSARTSVGFGVYRPFGELGDASVGIEVQRGWLDIDTGPGGTDLSGDEWTIRLTMSWAEDNWRARQLKNLGLDRWEIRD